MQNIPWRVVRRTGFDYVQLTLGAALLALNIALLLVPNMIVSGGATGIATILHYVIGTQVGTLVLIINIPLFIAGVKWGGGTRFAIRTIYATVVMSVLADLFAVWLVQAPAITDPLLYVLYGGLLDGVGMGLVFRGQGTTGGTDVVARLLHHWKGIPFGTTIMAVNSIVLIGAAAVFGLEAALYALILTFVAARVVDVVQGENNYGRAAIIVSGKAADIRSGVLTVLERGVTVLEGRGGYTEAGVEVLYCVVSRGEVSILKRLVQSIDPRAFVVITEASEVLGEGFRTLR
ncbi:hypothetical protein TFLX_01950 [Thermoflexales bacterium]|nr:hypothetical protein TFLX_01950 [Thermoflexales bacterium]